MRVESSHSPLPPFMVDNTGILDDNIERLLYAALRTVKTIAQST